MPLPRQESRSNKSVRARVGAKDTMLTFSLSKASSYRNEREAITEIDS